MLFLLLLKSVFPLEVVVVHHFTHLNVTRHWITSLSLPLEWNDQMSECWYSPNSVLFTSFHSYIFVINKHEFMKTWLSPLLRNKPWKALVDLLGMCRVLGLEWLWRVKILITVRASAAYLLFCMWCSMSSDSTISLNVIPVWY